MCRWMAYTGAPITVDALVSKPDHSLIHQSLNARQLALPGVSFARQFPGNDFPTQGEGYGVAWVGRDGNLGHIRDTVPAWDSQNLVHLVSQIESPCFLAHVRAAPGGSLSTDNNHPFVHDGWMFQHNGGVGDFLKLKRDLVMDVDPSLYPFIDGNTDSETLFYLSLTYGLANDPAGALRRMHDRVQQARLDHGVTAAFTGTFAASDGEQIFTMRVVSEEGLAKGDQAEAPTLYYATGPFEITAGDGPKIQIPQHAHVIASEPAELHYSPRTWRQIENLTIGQFRVGEEPLFTTL